LLYYREFKSFLYHTVDRYSPGTNSKQRVKIKKDFDLSEMGNMRGEKREVASFKVKKTRS
jgi:hypothetical protein